MPVAAETLLKSTRFISAKKELLEAISEAGQAAREIRPSNPELKERYAAQLQEYSKNRGRDLFFPFLGSGFGSGPFVELMDGSLKYDMITGIGINFFGHAHPVFVSEAIDSSFSDVHQGNLQPGGEAAELLKLLLSKVGARSRLKNGWLTTCGTMANENAIKVIRQKKFPATKILTFKDCFSGRSTLMAEITDNPGYRQGQPTYGEVHYLSFYDSKLSLEANLQRTLGEMREHLTRYPGKFCCLMLELVLGEGGFKAAPREWYVAVFEEAKKAGLAIFADEIQTFGRTGELFAYQKLQLDEYIDVATAAKMLQASVVLWAEEFNPKPGLVSGTFSGSNFALRAARKTIEMLTEGGYLGTSGKIEKLSNQFAQRLQKFSEGSCKGAISEIRVFGGMVAFAPHDGSLDRVKKVLHRMFDLGVVAFYCGHGPYLVRMLPPLGVLSEQDVDRICSIIEKAVLETR